VQPVTVSVVEGTVVVRNGDEVTVR